MIANTALGFDWDDGNFMKNREKHHVFWWECEQIFFNEPVVFPDEKHSLGEKRFYALGRTYNGRMLFVSFTIRKKNIRVISARDANRKEKRVYENNN